MHTGLKVAALFALCLGLSACPSQSLVQLKNKSFSVEIANDDESRIRGLMFREQMPNDHGMLFVFEDSAPRAFWMKNCKIPLDILYFDAKRTFINAHYGVPICSREPCPNYASDGDAKYVLELNAGVARPLQLQAGDAITLPASMR